MNTAVTLALFASAVIVLAFLTAVDAVGGPWRDVVRAWGFILLGLVVLTGSGLLIHWGMGLL